MDFMLRKWLKTLQVRKGRVFISIELKHRIMKMA